MKLLIKESNGACTRCVHCCCPLLVVWQSSRDNCQESATGTHYWLRVLCAYGNYRGSLINRYWLLVKHITLGIPVNCTWTNPDSRNQLHKKKWVQMVGLSIRSINEWDQNLVESIHNQTNLNLINDLSITAILLIGINSFMGHLN